MIARSFGSSNKIIYSYFSWMRFETPIPTCRKGVTPSHKVADNWTAGGGKVRVDFFSPNTVAAEHVLLEENGRFQGFLGKYFFRADVYDRRALEWGSRMQCPGHCRCPYRFRCAVEKAAGPVPIRQRHPFQFDPPQYLKVTIFRKQRRLSLSFFIYASMKENMGRLYILQIVVNNL